MHRPYFCLCVLGFDHKNEYQESKDVWHTYTLVAKEAILRPVWTANYNLKPIKCDLELKIVFDNTMLLSKIIKQAMNFKFYVNINKVCTNFTGRVLDNLH